MVVEADDVERIGDALFVIRIDRGRNHARGIEFVAAANHGGGDLRALLGHLALQLTFLIADRPDDDRWRVAVALDHSLQLSHALGAGAHLARLAHHHHAHAIAGVHPLGRGHVVRCADGVAAHLAQHRQPEPLQRIGYRRADTGMVLVIAGALDLHGLAIQEKPLVGIEHGGTHAEVDALGIADLCRPTRRSRSRSRDWAHRPTRGRDWRAARLRNTSPMPSTAMD